MCPSPMKPIFIGCGREAPSVSKPDSAGGGDESLSLSMVIFICSLPDGSQQACRFGQPARRLKSDLAGCRRRLPVGPVVQGSGGLRAPDGPLGPKRELEVGSEP